MTAPKTLQVERQDMLVGNVKGVSELQKIRQQINENSTTLEKMSVAFDKLLEYQECWRFIRERTLDDWAKARDQELQMQRNDIVHGGLIQADIDVLRSET